MPTVGHEYRPSPSHSWLRSNVLGLVAIFIALNGTAVAVQTASEGDSRKAVARKAAKKGKRGPAGPQGLAGPQGAQGIQGPQGASGLGGPPSGTAGGELAGTYPNPTIGTVDSLNLALSTQASPGVEFGPGGPKIYNFPGFPQALFFEAPSGLNLPNAVNFGDDVNLSNATTAGDAMRFGSTNSANLYRSAADTLHTDDSLDVDGGATVDGATTLGSAIVTNNAAVNGDATLGNASADTVTINGGPVNLPNATTAADAAVFGGDANLYRSAADTLQTDDSLSVANDLSVTDAATANRVTLPTLGAMPSPPSSGGTLYVDCGPGADTIRLRILFIGGGVETIITSFNPTFC